MFSNNNFLFLEVFVLSPASETAYFRRGKGIENERRHMTNVPLRERAGLSLKKRGLSVYWQLWKFSVGHREEEVWEWAVGKSKCRGICCEGGRK